MGIKNGCFLIESTHLYYLTGLIPDKCSLINYSEAKTLGNWTAEHSKIPNGCCYYYFPEKVNYNFLDLKNLKNYRYCDSFRMVRQA